MKKEYILKELKELLPMFKGYGIEQVAIFGSFAKGTFNDYSDIDIAIKKQKDFLKNYTAYDYFNAIEDIKSTLSKKFKRAIDIFDLDSQSSIKKDIEKELIYV